MSNLQGVLLLVAAGWALGLLAVVAMCRVAARYDEAMLEASRTGQREGVSNDRA